MLPFFGILFLLYNKNKNKNKVFLFLFLLHLVSYLSHFLVGRSIDLTLKTILNIFFVNLNLFLIIHIWNYSKIDSFFVKNNKFFIFFKKQLYRILTLNFFLNVGILIIISIFIPDIASFKAAKSFKNLYEEIPYFANIFRYAFVSQNLGYLK